MADESSSYIEVGPFSNSRRMRRGASSTVGVLMQRTPPCPGDSIWAPLGSPRPSKPRGHNPPDHQSDRAAIPTTRRFCATNTAVPLSAPSSSATTRIGLRSGRFHAAARQISSDLDEERQNPPCAQPRPSATRRAGFMPPPGRFRQISTRNGKIRRTLNAGPGRVRNWKFNLGSPKVSQAI
jgi:hypothetical protein